MSVKVRSFMFRSSVLVPSTLHWLLSLSCFTLSLATRGHVRLPEVSAGWDGELHDVRARRPDAAATPKAAATASASAAGSHAAGQPAESGGGKKKSALLALSLSQSELTGLRPARLQLSQGEAVRLRLLQTLAETTSSSPVRLVLYVFAAAVIGLMLWQLWSCRSLLDTSEKWEAAASSTAGGAPGDAPTAEKAERPETDAAAAPLASAPVAAAPPPAAVRVPAACEAWSGADDASLFTNAPGAGRSQMEREQSITFGRSNTSSSWDPVFMSIATCRSQDSAMDFARETSPECASDESRESSMTGSQPLGNRFTMVRSVASPRRSLVGPELEKALAERKRKSETGTSTLVCTAELDNSANDAVAATQASQARG
eukprot:TRINITY_DN29873_c0_g1_i1.p2 TRINITY_DN29873_c0_g1~~TRINITY_DN29873_c0_g1_i1.p2  ORF type:complete len:373 (-),score=79.47 TRINITY_DN29873_c0_g1_i1:448-1566(-)